MNDTGRVIWRFDFDAHEYAERIKYCLLRDIDGDGCKELVLSCEAYGDSPAVSFVPYRIFTWRNGAFRSYQRTARGGNPFAHIRKGNAGIYRVKGEESADGTNNGLYCLRQIEGQLWGDIVIKTIRESEYDKDERLSDDVKVVNYLGDLCFCKTARLDP